MNGHGKLNWLLGAALVVPAFGQMDRGAEVPVEIAERVALSYARQFYGDARTWEWTPYFGTDGKIEVYTFALYQGDGPLPTKTEVLAATQARHSALANLSEELRAVDTSDASGRTKAALRDEVNLRIAAKQREYTQVDRFITVLAGAHEGHVPVIRVHRGLPEHLTSAPYARDKAIVSHAIGEQLLRTFYLGPFDLGFEFVAARSAAPTDDPADSTLLVLTQGGKVVSLSELRRATQATMARRAQDSDVQAKLAERAAVLREKWSRARASTAVLSETPTSNAAPSNR
jgi:hypothetical protein